MKDLDSLRKEMDFFWNKHMVDTNLCDQKNTVIALNDLVRKLKKINRQLTLTQVKIVKSSDRIYAKYFRFLLSKRIELCTFVVNELRIKTVVDGNIFDSLMAELKGREDNFLNIMKRR